MSKLSGLDSTISSTPTNKFTMPKFGLYANSDYFLRQPSQKYFGGITKSIFPTGVGFTTSTDDVRAEKNAFLQYVASKRKISKTELSQDYSTLFTKDERLERSDTMVVSEDYL